MPVTEILNALLHLIAMNVHSGTMGMRSQNAPRMLIEIYLCQILHYRCEIAHDLEDFFARESLSIVPNRHEQQIARAAQVLIRLKAVAKK